MRKLLSGTPDRGDSYTKKTVKREEKESKRFNVRKKGIGLSHISD